MDDYRAARTGAASALTTVAVTIVLLDAVDANYETSPVILAALLGTIITLLGIEARSIVAGSRNDNDEGR